MAFLKDIFSRIARGAEPAPHGASGPAAPGVRFAVFGKHPAWDDHIDDIGLTTEKLVDFKRTFYLQGVGTNLDRGAWESLEPDQRTEGFDCLLLQRTGSSYIIARAVPSTDGKGRGRYPLVAAAQCTGMTPQVIASDVSPLVEFALDQFGQTTDRDRVFAIIAGVSGQLESLADATVVYSTPGAPIPAPLTLADLVSAPDLGDRGEKLHSVLFQAEREMKAFVRADGPPKPIPPNTPAASLRVPVCVDPPEESARLWVELLASRLNPLAPVLAIAAVGHRWVDLLVGDPKPADFFCLRASRKMLPFTTDIPFKMDDAFVARAAGLVAAMGRKGGSPGTVKRAPVLPPPMTDPAPVVPAHPANRPAASEELSAVTVEFDESGRLPESSATADENGPPTVPAVVSPPPVPDGTAQV